MTFRVFVSDDVSDSGLQPLHDAGFVIEKRTGLSEPQLREALSDCYGLIVRKETKVTDQLISFLSHDGVELIVR
jgi:D-3-phosphoglycerate dehydrogenase / 2-oxoglutarate reductase